MEDRLRYALAVLAMNFCPTPGTAWCELTLDRSSLLIHFFNFEDKAAFVTMVHAKLRAPVDGDF